MFELAESQWFAPQQNEQSIRSSSEHARTLHCVHICVDLCFCVDVCVCVCAIAIETRPTSFALGPELRKITDTKTELVWIELFIGHSIRRGFSTLLPNDYILYYKKIWTCEVDFHHKYMFHKILHVNHRTRQHCVYAIKCNCISKPQHCSQFNWVTNIIHSSPRSQHEKYYSYIVTKCINSQFAQLAHTRTIDSTWRHTELNAQQQCAAKQLVAFG